MESWKDDEENLTFHLNFTNDRVHVDIFLEDDNFSGLVIVLHLEYLLTEHQLGFVFQFNGHQSFQELFSGAAESFFELAIKVRILLVPSWVEAADSLSEAGLDNLVTGWGPTVVDKVNLIYQMVV